MFRHKTRGRDWKCRPLWQLARIRVDMRRVGLSAELCAADGVLTRMKAANLRFLNWKRIGCYAHYDFAFTTLRQLLLTLIKNSLSNTSSSRTLIAQGHYQHIVELPNDRNKIWNQLNRADDI